MPEIPTTQEVEIDAKQGRIKVRGSDVLTTFGIAAVVLVGYMVYEHKEDSRSMQSAFIGVVKEMTLAQKEMVTTQRVQNCLLTVEQRDREARLATCERLAK